MSLMLDVMAAIEDRLKTIPGLRTSDIVPDAISPPIAIVGIPQVTDYHGSLGRARMNLAPTVTVLTSQGWTRSGQQQLAAYADADGELSVLSAIEGDRSLGGVVGDCTVQAFRPLNGEEVGEIGYYGGVFTLLVLP
jgi:hypothetical protein